MKTLIGALVLACATASASPLQVAIIGAPMDSSWNFDVQQKLEATGDFSRVDVFDARTGTPSLAYLEIYSSVLVYTDGGFANAVTLGNNLADYIDRGGGVVVALFSDSSQPIGGRFRTSDYYAIEPNAQSEGDELTLGVIHDASSVLAQGLTTLNGGSSSYVAHGSLNANAVSVADWSNGLPLIATRIIGNSRRVDLNFYPPSQDVRAGLWNTSTDGAQLMANALVYAAGTEVPEPATVWSGGLALLLLVIASRRS